MSMVIIIFNIRHQSDEISLLFIQSLMWMRHREPARVAAIVLSVLLGGISGRCSADSCPASVKISMETW